MKTNDGITIHIGARFSTAINLDPRRLANQWVEVISHEDFCQGEPVNDGIKRNNRELQQTVAVRFLDKGPVQGQVAMIKADHLFNTTKGGVA